MATLTAVNNCTVLVIVTFALHKVVEMTHGCKVVCEQGIIPHFVARRDLQEWHFEA